VSVGLCLTTKVPQEEVLTIAMCHHYILHLLDLHDLVALHVIVGIMDTAAHPVTELAKSTHEADPLKRNQVRMTKDISFPFPKGKRKVLFCGIELTGHNQSISMHLIKGCWH
jgi:hypothetical protein